MATCFRVRPFEGPGRAEVDVRRCYVEWIRRVEDVLDVGRVALLRSHTGAAAMLFPAATLPANRLK